MDDILRNILLGISIAAPIGPATLTIIQSGLRKGFLRAFLTGVGITLADTTYLLIVFFGLTSLINLPMVKTGVWIFGMLVLFYLGYLSLREAFTRIDLDRQIRRTPESRSPLLVGYLVNISNPLAVVWWVGIYGSLLGATNSGSNKLSALLASSAILLGILAWHTSLSILTHWGKRILTEKLARIVTAIAGITLILFGLRFAWLAFSTLIK